MAPVKLAAETAPDVAPATEGGVAEPEILRTARYREEAYRAFLEGVSRIKSATVEWDARRPLVGQSIRVYVPSEDSPVWNQVLDVEAEVVSRYPRSGLDVWISDFHPTDAE